MPSVNLYLTSITARSSPCYFPSHSHPSLPSSGSSIHYQSELRSLRLWLELASSHLHHCIYLLAFLHFLRFVLLSPISHPRTLFTDLRLLIHFISMSSPPNRYPRPRYRSRTNTRSTRPDSDPLALGWTMSNPVLGHPLAPRHQRLTIRVPHHRTNSATYRCPDVESVPQHMLGAHAVFQYLININGLSIDPIPRRAYGWRNVRSGSRPFRPYTRIRPSELCCTLDFGTRKLASFVILSDAIVSPCFATPCHAVTSTI